MKVLLHRVGQVWHHIQPTTTPVLPPELATLLTPDARDRFGQLTPADQTHAIATAATLRSHGASRELVTAGLLHDIGKAMPGVRIHVTDRIAKVLLEWLWPGALRSLAASPTSPRGRAALWVLARHAGAGADLARGWGYSPRTCWLIAHHDDARAKDPELDLLKATDGDRKDRGATTVAVHG